MQIPLLQHLYWEFQLCSQPLKGCVHLAFVPLPAETIGAAAWSSPVESLDFPEYGFLLFCIVVC